MKYKVHKLEIHMEKDQDKLERFLNGLRGEVVTVIPNHSRISLAQIYGMARKINSLYVIERTAP